MEHLLRTARRIYAEEGPATMLAATHQYISKGLKACRWIGPATLVDRLRSVEKDAVMIVVRGSRLGPDTLPLILQCAEHLPDTSLCLAVNSKSKFEELSEPILPQLRTVHGNFEVIEINSKPFTRALLRSELLFLTSERNISLYRKLLQMSDRTVVRIYHGIITKAYGNLQASSMRNHRDDRNAKPDTYPNSFDIQSVASNIELFFRACAEGRHPAMYEKFGYPRFNRLDALLSGTAEPILPESTRKTLEETSPTARILYAPTQKGFDETNLFPFANFSLNDLRSFLEKRDAQLYLRMHPEEEDQLSNKVLDGQTILYAGQTFSTSPIEILPYFDLLITDYSSIYVDFLPVDKPIIFVKDDFKDYVKKRGIAYDYEQYFPGPKPETFDAFLESIEVCLAGEDGNEDERAFVRNVFLPPQDDIFLNQVLGELNL